jgi:hypothetical protein
MDTEEAQGRALRTALRAAQHGLNLDNPGDPDVGALIVECRRQGLPIGSVLIDE